QVPVRGAEGEHAGGQVHGRGGRAVAPVDAGRLRIARVRVGEPAGQRHRAPLAGGAGGELQVAAAQYGRLVQNDLADFVGVVLVEPNVAVRAGDGAERAAVGRRRRVFADLAVDGDPADLAGLGLAEPQGAVRADGHSVRAAAGGRDGEPAG